MNNKTINLFNSSGEEVVVGIKPFISANMLVEVTRIYRKYAKKHDQFVAKINEKGFDLDSLSDKEYLKAKQYLLELQERVNEYQNKLLTYYDLQKEIGDGIGDSDIKSRKKIVDNLRPSSNFFKNDDIYTYWGDDLNIEILQLVINYDSIIDREILEMLKDSSHSLWGEQDIDSFRSVCKDFYQ